MIAYLDIPSGISGDMVLGCLVDGGWSIDALRQTLSQLRLPGDEYAIHADAVTQGPLRATRVTVNVKQTHHRRTLPQIRSIIGDSSLPQ